MPEIQKGAVKAPSANGRCVAASSFASCVGTSVAKQASKPA